MNMAAELLQLAKAQQAAYKAAHDAGYDMGLHKGELLRTELLTALKALRFDHSRIEPHHEELCMLCTQADAAIAKAEGKS